MVFATDDQMDENLVALQPVRGYKHLTASVKMLWTDKPRWRLETTEPDFLDAFDGQSIDDHDTDSSALSDIFQSFNRDTVEDEIGDRTIKPSTIADTRVHNLDSSSDDSWRNDLSQVTKESAYASSILASWDFTADSHQSKETRDTQGPASSTFAAGYKSRPTLAAIVAQHIESKGADPKSSSGTNNPQIKVSTVVNTPLPKMPVKVVTKPVAVPVKASISKAAPASMYTRHPAGRT